MSQSMQTWAGQRRTQAQTYAHQNSIRTVESKVYIADENGSTGAQKCLYRTSYKPQVRKLHVRSPLCSALMSWRRKPRAKSPAAPPERRRTKGTAKTAPAPAQPRSGAWHGSTPARCWPWAWHTEAAGPETTGVSGYELQMESLLDTPKNLHSTLVCFSVNPRTVLYRLLIYLYLLACLHLYATWVESA